MILLKLVYMANILVAGWISITSLFFPKVAAATIFQNAYPTNEVIRLVGCLWFAIAVLSVFGLWQPVIFSPVLLLQFIYKGTWLLLVAIPAIINKQSYPSSMAVFFFVWVLVLPFSIPWSQLLK